VLPCWCIESDTLPFFSRKYNTVSSTGALAITGPFHHLLQAGETSTKLWYSHAWFQVNAQMWKKIWKRAYIKPLTLPLNNWFLQLLKYGPLITQPAIVPEYYNNFFSRLTILNWWVKEYLEISFFKAYQVTNLIRFQKNILYFRNTPPKMKVKRLPVTTTYRHGFEFDQRFWIMPKIMINGYLCTRTTNKDCLLVFYNSNKGRKIVSHVFYYINLHGEWPTHSASTPRSSYCMCPF